MDEHNLRLFLFCTHSVAGALPLGIVITSDEQTETLVKEFSMFKEMLPENSFFNKGFPDVFMTDNCAELREALSEIFPLSRLLLCVFHILQQVWRWLYEKKHGISSHDRLEIMKHFRRLVYIEEEESFQRLQDEFFELANVVKYPSAVLYFSELGMEILIFLNIRKVIQNFVNVPWYFKHFLTILNPNETLSYCLILNVEVLKTKTLNTK